MSDWNKPTLTDLYVDILTFLAGKDVDAVTLVLDTVSATNLPTGAMNYDRNNKVFREWNGSSWVNKVVEIAGGGTGATTAAGARTALGIGTMGTQNSNAVTITGGSISGLATLELGTGALTVDTDNLRDLGTFAKQLRKAYFKSAFVLPVGADKYATS